MKPGTRYRTARGDYHRVVKMPHNGRLGLLNEETWVLDSFNLWPEKLAEIVETMTEVK